MPAMGPSGKRLHDAPPPGGVFLPVERKILAVDAGALFGGDVEGKDGALDLDARGFDGLARFLGQGAGEFFFALAS